MFAYGELGPLSDKIETAHARVHHAIVQAQIYVLNDKTFNQLSLYEQRITRNVHKNMKLLFELQARRKSEERLNANTQPLTRSASGGADPNGSGFANRSGLSSGSLIPREADAEPPATGQGSGFALTFPGSENPVPAATETSMATATPSADLDKAKKGPSLVAKDADSELHAPRQAA